MQTATIENQPHLNLVRVTTRRPGQAGATGRVIHSACYRDDAGGEWLYVKWDHLEGRYSYHRRGELEPIG